MDRDPDAKLQVIAARATANHMSPHSDGMLHSMMRQRLTEQLASVLASDAMVVTKQKYHTEFEVRCYVLTHDQLEKYVQRRAERLSMHPNYIFEGQHQ
jgi:tRNA(His) 5'-end guanylyltransferase